MSSANHQQNFPTPGPSRTPPQSPPHHNGFAGLAAPPETPHCYKSYFFRRHDEQLEVKVNCLKFRGEWPVWLWCDVLQFSSIHLNRLSYLGHKACLKVYEQSLVVFVVNPKKKGGEKIKIWCFCGSKPLFSCDSDKAFDRSTSIDIHKWKLLQYSF